MKPKISIVIPTKNEEDYLERTLKQYIPLKKRFGIEVIVSDGGSTDNTLDIAEKYADKVVLPKKGKKQNIAIGRNAGAWAADGDIIFETDADVLIPRKEEFFEKINEVFRDSRVVAALARLEVYPDEERIDDAVFHFIINTMVRHGKKLGLGKGECQIIRASAFRKINGYDESVVVGEDGNLFYRIAKVGKIHYIKGFSVHHSPRRFRNDGYLKVFFQYVREGAFLLFTRRSYLKEWAPQR